MMNTLKPTSFSQLAIALLNITDIFPNLDHAATASQFKLAKPLLLKYQVTTTKRETSHINSLPHIACTEDTRNGC